MAIKPTSHQAQPNRFIRLPEVREMCGVGASTIYRWISQGEFPKQKKLPGRTVAWCSSEIIEWMANREAA